MLNRSTAAQRTANVHSKAQHDRTKRGLSRGGLNRKSGECSSYETAEDGVRMSAKRARRQVIQLS